MSSSHIANKPRTFRSGPYLNDLFRRAERMHEDLRREICGRIRKARKAADMTQQEFADLLGLTLRGYQNYENLRVPWDRLGDIARLTGVTEEWLLRGDQPPAARADEERVTRLEERVEDVQQKLVRALEMLEDLQSRPTAR